MAAVEVQDRQSETEIIFNWRVESFAGLGWSDAEARMLASSDNAELSLARLLLGPAMNCSHGLAFRILV